MRYFRLQNNETHKYYSVLRIEKLKNKIFIKENIIRVDGVNIQKIRRSYSIEFNIKYRLYNQGLVLLFPSHVSLHLSINKVKWLICKILNKICSKSKYLIIGLCL